VAFRRGNYLLLGTLGHEIRLSLLLPPAFARKHRLSVRCLRWRGFEHYCMGLQYVSYSPSSPLFCEIKLIYETRLLACIQCMPFDEILHPGTHPYAYCMNKLIVLLGPCLLVRAPYSLLTHQPTNLETP
jgi:hypothetical protein